MNDENKQRKNSDKIVISYYKGSMVGGKKMNTTDIRHCKFCGKMITATEANRNDVVLGGDCCDFCSEKFCNMF